MAESGQPPPRLPDPPNTSSPFGYSPGRGDVNLTQTTNTQYMQDLVRALEFYITQQEADEVSNNSKSISWFMG